MQTDYNLITGETIIEQVENIDRYVTERKTESGNLILTNKRIIWITKSFWGKTKNVLYFQLDRVITYNDKANITIEEGFDEPTILTIQFNDTVEKYDFQEEKKKAKSIANQINKIVTGMETDIYSAHRSIPGVATLADTLKGTIDTFKDNFIGRKMPEKISINCPSCGASYDGYKGQISKCPYCGKVQ